MAKRKHEAALRPGGLPDSGMRLTGRYADYWNEIVAQCLDALQGGGERPSANTARAAEKGEDLS